MNGVFFAVPAAIPEPPLPVWQGMQHRWTGWNGVSFDLNDFTTAGVALLIDGVAGLHMPEFDQYLDESASVPGGRYRGSRARTRTPEWILGVFAQDATSQVWLERDRALWGTMHPDRPGTWTVTLPDGTSRSLLCRFRSSAPYSYGRDPMQAGWAIYQVTLMAEQPFWEGPEIASPTWGTASDDVDFTGPTDEAPDFYIGSGTSLAAASLHNPSDVDGWLRYVVTGGASGGLTSVTIAAGGGELAFGAVPEGSVLTIDTDPTVPLALLDGVDVTGDIDPWDPRPIPAGETADLSIALVGNGTISATFTPRYFRAF